jgi:hypothetical protein
MTETDIKRSESPNGEGPYYLAAFSVIAGSLYLWVILTIMGILH